MKIDDPVMQSFGRCCARAGFFEAFYDRLLASSADVRAHFVNTDMPMQRQLIRHGILNLVMYGRGLPATKLKALGESHSRQRMNIHPSLYRLWIDALLETIEDQDPQADAAVLQAWRNVLEKGIDVIRAGY